MFITALCKILMKKSIYHWKAKILFGNVGTDTYCLKPLRIINGKYVSIGKNVSILPFLRLEVYKLDKNSIIPQIIIGNDVNIEQNVHITSGYHIHIGNECSILAGSVITDIIHPYDDVDVAASGQACRCKPVNIGEQCFIGTHAIIMPGVTLGKHVIVGANSVVTHSFPDNCVVAGVPAKIIKQYNKKLHKWIFRE